MGDVTQSVVLISLLGSPRDAVTEGLPTKVLYVCLVYCLIPLVSHVL
jgi:hypothetical protein